MNTKEINEYLIKKLDENYEIERSKVLFKKIPSSLKILEVRDKLLIIGLITEEDLEHNTYVATIKVGFAGLSSAHISLMVESGVMHIAAYAKEGIINQNLSKKAIEKITGTI